MNSFLPWVAMREGMSLDEIVVGCPITDDLGRKVSAQMRSAWSYYHFPEVTLRLSSPGGELLGMERILDEIGECRSEGVRVRTICDGPVASAAAIIASAGSPGMREASPQARLLYHEPRYRALGDMPHTESRLYSLASGLNHATERMLENLLGQLDATASETEVMLSPENLSDRLATQFAQAHHGDGPWPLREAYRTLFRLELWISPEEACALRLLDHCTRRRLPPYRAEGGRRPVGDCTVNSPDPGMNRSSE